MANIGPIRREREHPISTTREVERGERLFDPGRLRRFITDRIPKGERVLDMGCGSGRAFALPLAIRGYRVDAIDTKLEAIQNLDHVCVKKGALNQQQASMDTFLQQSGDKYGVIVASNSLMFLPKERGNATIRAMQEHTKAGGLNVISVLTQNDTSNKVLGDVYPRLFTNEELLAMYPTTEWEILHHEEYTTPKETHSGAVAEHQHAIAELVVKKRSWTESLIYKITEKLKSRVKSRTKLMEGRRVEEGYILSPIRWHEKNPHWWRARKREGTYMKPVAVDSTPLVLGFDYTRLLQFKEQKVEGLCLPLALDATAKLIGAIPFKQEQLKPIIQASVSSGNAERSLNIDELLYVSQARGMPVVVEKITSARGGLLRAFWKDRGEQDAQDVRHNETVLIRELQQGNALVVRVNVERYNNPKEKDAFHWVSVVGYERRNGEGLVTVFDSRRGYVRMSLEHFSNAISPYKNNQYDGVARVKKKEV